MPNQNKILRILSYHFGKPEKTTWSFCLMYSSIMVVLFYAAKCNFNDLGLPFSSTSLVGFSIIMPIFILFSLIIPALLLKDDTSSITGRYTGAGILTIAFMSGFPLMLLSTVLYNLLTWTVLRMGSKIIYPAFFYYGGTESKAGNILALLTDSVIPALGYCLFFFGLIWSRFKYSEKKLAYLVITIAFTLFSMDILGVFASILTAWWCCRLRDKTDGIYAPFLCLVSAKISSILFANVVSKINIYTIQTYSDIPSTFFYASLPAILIGCILLAFFTRFFDDYHRSYTGSEPVDDDMTLPTLTRNLNFGLIIAMLAMITIWILIYKGVHL